MLFSSSVAFAAEEVTTVDPGVTPDSSLYTFERLFEDMNLFFTFSEEKEATLLLDYAKERLAEATAMAELEKEEYVKEAIADYQKLLAEAKEQVAEVILNEETTSETTENLNEAVEEATNVEDKVTEALPEEQANEVIEVKEEIKIVANVVEGLDKDKVAELRGKDLGFGQISQIFALAKISGKTVDEVAEMFLASEGKGFGEVAKELGFNPSEVKGKSAEIRKAKLEEKIEKAKAKGNDKLVTKLEGKLNKLTPKEPTEEVKEETQQEQPADTTTAPVTEETTTPDTPVSNEEETTKESELNGTTSTLTTSSEPAVAQEKQPKAEKVKAKEEKKQAKVEAKQEKKQAKSETKQEKKEKN
ncbi:MAG: hypothetical protein K0S51_2246 [Bacillales bacterium]|jgi:hypothetical protein|nr:hypothetical protein [Bacillales bacterium]